MRDLYDWEIQKCAKAFAECSYLCANTRATINNVKEVGKRIQDIFEKQGFMVSVDMSPCLILLPNGRTDGPKVEIIGFVNDPEDKQEFDHDEKQFEVLDSRTRGEKYRGDRERVNRKR